MILLAITAMGVALYAPAQATSAIADAAPLATIIENFAVKHNIIAGILILPLFCSAVLRLSRATIRISLYPASTMAAIALAAVVLLAMTSGAEALKLMIIAFLACYCLGRLLGCFGPSIRSQRLFASMLAAGCMPLIDSALLAVLVIFLLLIIFIRRTLRESVIAIVGATLPLLVYSYITWCLGGEFSSTIIALWQDITTPAHTEISTYATLPRMIFVTLLVIMQLSTSAVYISDRMSLGPGVRHAWNFLQLLFAAMAILCIALPATSPSLFVVATLPVVTMLPMLLMRIPAYLSTLLFVILLAAAYTTTILNIIA